MGKRAAFGPLANSLGKEPNAAGKAFVFEQKEQERKMLVTYMQEQVKVYVHPELLHIFHYKH